MSSASNRQARLLEEVLKLPGNNVCADCRAMAPRWASINLGVFLCVQCASVHRKLGTHLSRVKSCTMDSWTREQVDSMRQLGNTHQNSIYNPDTSRHPPPTSTAEFNDRDSELEKHIRKKWVQKAFMPSASGSAGLQAPSPGRPRASTTSDRRLGSGGDVPHGLDQRNSRHTELNDIVVPIPRGRAELPPLPPSRSPVFNAGGKLRDERTGGLAGSGEVRRRPSPSAGMGSFTAGGVFGSAGTAEASGTGKSVAAKNHVESNWADLLGMDGPPTLAPAVHVRSAPPTPRRVTSPNPQETRATNNINGSYSSQGQGSTNSANSGSSSSTYLTPNTASNMSNFSPRFDSPSSTNSGAISMFGSPYANQAPSFGQPSGRVGMPAQMQGHGQIAFDSSYGSPAIQQTQFNPFNGNQQVGNQYQPQQQHFMTMPVSTPGGHPFPLAQQQYGQQSPFPPAQSPMVFAMPSSSNGSYFGAMGQSMHPQGQQNGSGAYLTANQGVPQGFVGQNGPSFHGGYGPGTGGAKSQAQQFPPQPHLQQPQQASNFGSGITNTQYSGMMMPAGWGGAQR